MEKFEKWLIYNNACEDGYLSLDKDNKISIEEVNNILDELSNKLNFDIFSSKKYKDIKRVMDNLCDNKKIFKKKYDLYLEVLNYYLKYMYTTYEKKEDLEDIVNKYNCNNLDISDISIYSNMIYEELCKWPHMYTIIDKDNNYINVTTNNGKYNMVCIPLYSNIELIDKSLLEGCSIKKVRINKFLEEFDNDSETHAVAVVINPNFENDKVFIDKGKAFWYYFPDLSNYF